MRWWFPVVVLFAVAACRGESPRAAAPSSDPVLARVCAGPCADRYASVTVWSDAQGAVGRYQLEGSPTTCSHPPTTYFDARGEVTGTVPMVAVAPGSPEAARLRAIHDEQTAGLTRTRRVTCPVARGEPGTPR